jgi:hypothetical protein
MSAAADKLVEEMVKAMREVLRISDRQHNAWAAAYAAIAAYEIEKRLIDLCACRERHACDCPGEWEPGCDLGANPRYARGRPT